MPCCAHWQEEAVLFSAGDPDPSRNPPGELERWNQNRGDMGMWNSASCGQHADTNQLTWTNQQGHTKGKANADNAHIRARLGPNKGQMRAKDCSDLLQLSARVLV